VNGKVENGELMPANEQNITKNEQPTQMAQITPLTMMQTALERGTDMDQLEKLMALQERWEANEAKKAYVVAMNAFKKNPPEIFKDRHVSYTTDKGTTEYTHASLANIVKTIGQALAKHGLSHRWDMNTADGGIITVTCVITHKLGHSESVPMEAGADQSGGKNNIQAKGSTITYLQRYTLLAATGLATADMDDDGQTAEPVEYITEHQEAELRALLEEVGADYGKFCQYCKVTALKDIQAKNYKKAVSALEAKREK